MATATEFIEQYIALTTFKKFHEDVINIPAFQTKESPDLLVEESPEYTKSDLFPLDVNVRERWNRIAYSGVGYYLDTDIPELKLDFDEFVDCQTTLELDSFASCLSFLVSYSSRAMRWEPQNTYQVHRYIASARCLFTCSMRFALRQGRSSTFRIYSYMSDQHALLSIGECTLEEETDAEIILCVVGDMAATIIPYGDFSPNLAAPESGLLTAQLQILCRAIGWEYRAELIASSSQLESMFCIDEYGQIPYVALKIKTKSGEFALGEHVEIMGSEAVPQRGKINNYNAATKFISVMAERKSNESILPVEYCSNIDPIKNAVLMDKNSQDNIDLFAVLRRRNSGSYLIGFVPKKDGFKKVFLERLISSWVKLARLQGLNASTIPKVHCYLLVLSSLDGSPRQIEIDMERGSIANVTEIADLGERFRKASTMPMANFKELNLGVIFTFDYSLSINVYKESVFNIAHTLTGMLAGSFSLAAARENMFARPVRMYDENVFTENFDVKGTPIIQLLCGFNRNSRLSFEIG